MRLSRGVIAALVAVTIFAMGTGSAIATVELGKVSDPIDTPGKINLRSVYLKQSGPKLVLGARTRDEWSLKWLDPRPADLNDPGRFLCFQIRQQQKSRVLCTGLNKAGQSRVYRAKLKPEGRTGKFKPVVGAVLSRPSRKGISATLDIQAAGLSPGKLRWSAASNWSGPDCEATEAGNDDEFVVVGIDCRDQAPDSAQAKARIRTPRITGCTSKPGVVRHGARNRKWIALTYDDGPSPYTRSILGTLDKAGAKATFFVVGNVVGGRAADARAVIAQGSEIANHSWAHEMNPGLASLRSANQAIAKATGFRPCMFRPPYGSTGGSTLSAARSLGLTTVIWDVDTSDYTSPGSGAIQSRALAGHHGSIVLMHDGGGNRAQTVAATKGIVNTLKLRGYKMVTVSEMLGAKTAWAP